MCFCWSYQAYAGFFYTAKALLMNGTTDLDQFNASVKTFCHTNWTTVSVYKVRKTRDEGKEEQKSCSFRKEKRKE